MKLFLKTLFWDVAIYLSCWVFHVILMNLKVDKTLEGSEWLNTLPWWPIQPLWFVIYLMVAFNLVIFSHHWFSEKKYDI